MKEVEQLQYDYLKHFLLANNVHEQNFKKIAIIPQYHNVTPKLCLLIGIRVLKFVMFKTKTHRDNQN